MIRCPKCGTEHLNLKLARGQTKLCNAAQKDGSRCTKLLTHGCRVSTDTKYDKYSFVPAARVKPKTVVIHVGRPKSAPSVTNWLTAVVSPAVTYVSSTATSTRWQNPTAQDVRLPFTALDPMIVGLQGLVIDFPPLAAKASAQAHFAAITTAMTAPKKPQDVTEAVGEAAAAMAIMTAFPAYELLWGFDVHSGAGIDQIWWNADAAHPHYLVVEAKGPGASLGDGALDNPPGYEQMEKLWVIDRLGRMRSGVGGPLANRILADLALDITVALPNYNKGSKSYYGCARSTGKLPTGTLSGLTVTAQWGADAMLGGVSVAHAYVLP